MSRYTKYLRPRFILLPFLIGFFFYQQGPALYRNFQDKGERIEPVEIQRYQAQDIELFPQAEQKAIVIFWVSWCRPCHMEMARFQSAIESGHLDPKKIYAFNPFETQAQIARFLSERTYDFQFAQDFGGLVSQLQVQGTPTILHIKNNTIEYIRTGISPVSIWRARYFLN